MAARRPDLIRTVADIDRDLEIVAMVRAAVGGSTTLLDQLLDERLECPAT